MARSTLQFNGSSGHSLQGFPSFQASGRFQFQQRLLVMQSTAVADKFATAADDAMAGDDDGNGIATIGQSDGPRSCGVADGSCNFSVTRRDSPGHLTQSIPDASLKFSAFCSQWHVENP